MHIYMNVCVSVNVSVYLCGCACLSYFYFLKANQNNEDCSPTNVKFVKKTDKSTRSSFKGAYSHLNDDSDVLVLVLSHVTAIFIKFSGKHPTEPVRADIIWRCLVVFQWLLAVENPKLMGESALQLCVSGVHEIMTAVYVHPSCVEPR